MNFNFLIRKKQKGQAFSTFQLLIAAVVALALLGVLMPIIMNVLGFAQGDPTSTSKQLIKSQLDNPDALLYTEQVAFTNSKKTLSAAGITKDTGLPKEQVAFIFPDSLSNDFSVNSTNSVLTYKKSSTTKAKVGVLCSETVVDLQTAFNSYLEDELEGKFASTDIPGLFTVDGFDDSITACVVFPVKSI
ncbi:MAG: hypothetical protein V1824_00040 [archaeon]